MEHQSLPLQAAAPLADLHSPCWLAAVYGNLYDRRRKDEISCHRSEDGQEFRMRTSWPTGGAGTLVPSELVARITLAGISQWARGPGGIDLHFACAAAELGFELRHLPTRFLDACMYCDEFQVERLVLSCHAAEAFRHINRCKLGMAAQHAAQID